MMSQQQFINLTSNLLKEKHAFTSLVAKKERKKENVGVAKSLGTWPKIVGIKQKEKKGRQSPKTSLRY